MIEDTSTSPSCLFDILSVVFFQHAEVGCWKKAMIYMFSVEKHLIKSIYVAIERTANIRMREK